MIGKNVGLTSGARAGADRARDRHAPRHVLQRQRAAACTIWARDSPATRRCRRGSPCWPSTWSGGLDAGTAAADRGARDRGRIDARAARLRRDLSRAATSVGLAPRTAFTVAMRVYRGGGLTKDAIYLRGLEQVSGYLAAGGEVERLLVGKVAIAAGAADSRAAAARRAPAAALAAALVDRSRRRGIALRRWRAARRVLDLVEGAIHENRLRRQRSRDRGSRLHHDAARVRGARSRPRGLVHRGRGSCSTTWTNRCARMRGARRPAKYEDLKSYLAAIKSEDARRERIERRRARRADAAQRSVRKTRSSGRGRRRRHPVRPARGAARRDRAERPGRPRQGAEQAVLPVLPRGSAAERAHHAPAGRHQEVRRDETGRSCSSRCRARAAPACSWCAQKTTCQPEPDDRRGQPRRLRDRPGVPAGGRRRATCGCS